jgi:hypothetical protein
LDGFASTWIVGRQGRFLGALFHQRKYLREPNQRRAKEDAWSVRESRFTGPEVAVWEIGQITYPATPQY